MRQDWLPNTRQTNQAFPHLAEGKRHLAVLPMGKQMMIVKISKLVGGGVGGGLTQSGRHSEFPVFLGNDSPKQGELGT